MAAFRGNGVNVTDVTVVYCPPSPRDRAVVIVTVRPGRYPTTEASDAISRFLEAVKGLQEIRNI